jgi:hypothetical protein
MRFTEMFLLAACALFPTLLVAGNNVGLEETVKFEIQGKRDIAIRNLLVPRGVNCNGYDGFYCVAAPNCCIDGWGCCAGMLFF